MFLHILHYMICSIIEFIEVLLFRALLLQNSFSFYSGRNINSNTLANREEIKLLKNTQETCGSNIIFRFCSTIRYDLNAIILTIRLFFFLVEYKRYFITFLGAVMDASHLKRKN